MHFAFRSTLSRSFAPPHYLAPVVAGIDISPSGIKSVRLARRSSGVVLERYQYTPLAEGAYAQGEAVDKAAVVSGLQHAVQAMGTRTIALALPESKSYLFETTAPGSSKEAWRLAIEQRLEELVPLPPTLTAFDFLRVGQAPNGDTQVVGVGFAERVIAETLSLTDAAGLTVASLEAEHFPMTRALLAANDQSTVLIVDIGKSTTKLCVASHGVPRFTTTLGIGGYTLTRAIEKYFGVDDKKAQEIKVEEGIENREGREALLEAMLPTVSALRDEIMTRLQYWQTKVAAGHIHEPVSHCVLTGGNGTVRGIQEYLEKALEIPVTSGNVFTRFAPRDAWMPPLRYADSLSYGTAIGLALPHL